MEHVINKNLRSVLLGILFLQVITVCAYSTEYPKNNTGEGYSDSEAFAMKLDAADPLKHMKKEFHYPAKLAKKSIYFNGNSLGLQPIGVKQAMLQELQDWAELGVEGHFKTNDPWYTFHKQFAPTLAKLVGASPDEVVAMNTLTVNLHLMLTTFYQPQGKRTKIIMEAPVFSSDTYAIKSQIQLHGLDPKEHLIIVHPNPSSQHLTVNDIKKELIKHDGEVALVLLSAVNFLTGQAIDVPNIVELAHNHGAYIGLDLAHAIGNVPLTLHKSKVDFAVWCSYKYLNAGPGAIGGVFVHEQHAKNTNLARLAGWWGNDPEKRFLLHLEENFTPMPTADGWQLSNPPIFSLLPLKASLKLYDAIGMEAYRNKSLKLTGYLEFMLQPHIANKHINIITPTNPGERGCQLSLIIASDAKQFHNYLKKQGVICDFREPNVIRVAPVPFYNTFHEVWRFAQLVNQYFA